jgi:uncharacterized membrane protein YfcA
VDQLTFWFVGFLAAFCVGLGKGGVPVITALGVPIMSLLMSPILAAGLLLPVFIAADMLGLYAYRRTFNPRVLKIMVLALPIGVFIGWLTSTWVSEAAVTLLIGLIGALFALTMILRKPVAGPAVHAKVGPGLFWGAISGFTSFVSHSGSVPYQIYTLPLRMDKLTFVGTVTIAFAYINVVKLIPYYALGQLGAENIRAALVLLVPALLGVVSGVRLVRVVPEKTFFRIIIWALLILSLKLIWDGGGLML